MIDSEEETEAVFLFIQEDGGIIVVQSGEKTKHTQEQLEILKRILACYEPSVFLWVFLKIEIYLRLLTEYLYKMWRQDR